MLARFAVLAAVSRLRPGSALPRNQGLGLTSLGEVSILRPADFNYDEEEGGRSCV